MDDCGQTEQQLVWFGCGTEALMPHMTDEQMRVQMTREEDLSFYMKYVPNVRLIRLMCLHLGRSITFSKKSLPRLVSCNYSILQGRCQRKERKCNP